VADGNQDGLTRKRKTRGNWVVETGGRMPRKEVAGDIFLSRPRPTQGCTADDDDDDDDDKDKGKDKLPPCTSTETLYRPYGP